MEVLFVRVGKTGVGKDEMIEHSFGGDWTDDKLARLQKYIIAYRNIFAAGRARYYKTWYVDAFAGTGSRSSAESMLVDWETMIEDSDAQRYRDGSARIAMSLKSPFDHYLFIDKRKAHCDELQRVIENEFSHLKHKCRLMREDANAAICAWSAERDWNKERAVVFLDPYGLQVEWKTIEALGKSCAVDLWYLFPLSVIRLLKRDGNIDPQWKARLTKLFGTPDWEPRFYSHEIRQNLFGEEDVLVRDASVDSIQQFIDERLSTCFVRVAKGRVLKNSNGSPLYSLCFAAANEKGAPTAIKIANSILLKD